jgi:hypothetical protein
VGLSSFGPVDSLNIDLASSSFVVGFDRDHASVVADLEKVHASFDHLADGEMDRLDLILTQALKIFQGDHILTKMEQ